MDLSIVIPSYNEHENIKSGTLETVSYYLKGQPYSWEVILVNDGSVDDTAQLLESFASSHDGFKFFDEPHRGKAATVMAGVSKAVGDIVLFTDMDQATPIDQLEKVLPEFEKGADVVIGSRNAREGAPFTRKLMAYGFIFLRTIILRLPFKDTQCGFKAFKRESIKSIFQKLSIFKEKKTVSGAAVKAGFDLEVLFVARKLKLKIVEVPVVWHHRGTVRVNPIKDSIDGFKDLLAVRLNALLGKYNV